MRWYVLEGVRHFLVFLGCHLHSCCHKDLDMRGILLVLLLVFQKHHRRKIDCENHSCKVLRSSSFHKEWENSVDERRGG